MIGALVKSIKTRLAVGLDLLFLFAEKALRILISAGTGIVVARALGAARYGELSAAIATATVFASTAGMNADNININKLSNRARVHVYRLLIFTRLTIALSLTIVYILICFFAEPSIRVIAIRLCLVPIVTVAAYNVNQHLLLAHQRYRIYTVISLLVMVTGSIIKLVLSVAGADTIYFALAIAGEAMLLMILYRISVGSLLVNQIKIKRATFRRLRRSFTPFLPGLFAAVIVSLAIRVEIIVVSSNMGNEAAGEWAVATMFLTPWLLIASSLTPMINVKLAVLRGQKSTTAYGAAIQDYIRAFFLLGSLGTLATAIIAMRFGSLIFGVKYPSAPFLAAILSVAISFQIQGVLQDVWLAQAGRRIVALKKSTVTLIISSLFAYAASTTHNILYVGTVSVISNIIGAVLLNAVFDREYFRLQIVSVTSLMVRKGQ